jgi:hypothetical protein
VAIDIRVRDGNVVKFGNRDDPNAVSWWAELGRIHHQNERTGEYGSLSRRDFLLRLQALNDLNKNGSSSRSIYDVSERLRIQRFVEAAIALVRRAQQQGDPDDASVRRYRVDNETRPIAMSSPSGLILPASFTSLPGADNAAAPQSEAQP